jgi:predicted O-linked N-acetylglucosamine transferase (SPINDLY family)
MVRLWAKLLERAPDSRLAVHVPGGQNNPSIIRRIISLGVPGDRLVVFPRLGLEEYLNLYNQIDIALDPFPYGGGTTSFDALWMGVPLVTLEGSMPLGRAGASILRNVGLVELIATSPEQYVEIAAGLAGDADRIASLRSSLRQRVSDSPLTDAPRYVRNLEAAYRLAWRESLAAAR